MKKILYSSAIFCLLFASCKKDVKSVQNRTQKVTFKVGFSTTTGAYNPKATASKLKVNSADTSVTNYVKVIYYMVFKSDGSFLHSRSQLSTAADFGTYTDNLAPGTYTVTIAAGESDLAITQGTLSTTKMLSPKAFQTANLFFKKIPITVAGTDQSQSVALNRVISKVVLKTTDLIPDGANTATLKLTGVANAFNFGTEKGDDVLSTYSVTKITSYSDFGGLPPFPTGVPLEISTYLIYNTPFTATIEVVFQTADTRTLYASKTISNIQGATNALITLTGSIFGGTTGNSSFKPVIDTAWNAPINQNF